MSNEDYLFDKYEKAIESLDSNTMYDILEFTTLLSNERNKYKNALRIIMKWIIAEKITINADKEYEIYQLKTDKGVFVGCLTEDEYLKLKEVDL